MDKIKILNNKQFQTYPHEEGMYDLIIPKEYYHSFTLDDLDFIEGKYVFNINKYNNRISSYKNKSTL